MLLLALRLTGVSALELDVSMCLVHQLLPILLLMTSYHFFCMYAVVVDCSLDDR